MNIARAIALSWLLVGASMCAGEPEVVPSVLSPLPQGPLDPRAIDPDPRYWRQTPVLSHALDRARAWMRSLTVEELPEPTVSVVQAGRAAIPGFAGDMNYVWKFEFVNIAVGNEPPAGGSGQSPETRRDVEVLLVPGTLTLLRVTLRASDAKQVPTAEPSAASAARQRQNAGPERWGVPNEPMANLSLADALKALDNRGMGSWKAAATVIANYVLWAKGLELNSKPREAVPAWSIDLRGSMPIPTSKPVHPDAINHLRHVVDMTGKWRMANSVPQPDPPASPAPSASPLSPSPPPGGSGGPSGQSPFTPKPPVQEPPKEAPKP